MAELQSRRSAQEIWDLLMDPQRGPFWQVTWQGRKRYSLKCERRGWRQESSGPSSLVFVEEEAASGAMLRLGVASSLRGSWTIRLESRPDGTRVLLEERDVPSSWLDTIGGALGRRSQAEEFLSDLAKRLGETG